MILLSSKWSDAFVILGLGMGIVFFVLVLLIFLLTFSGWIFTRQANKTENNVSEKAIDTNNQTTNEDLSDEEKAAVAMALHLFYADVHDEESYVITIDDNNPQSAWNSKMYNLNNLIN